MTDAHPAVLLEKAHAYALSLAEFLAPYVHRVTVGGSIRRARPEVHDIELIAIPRYEGQPTLIPGESIRGENLLWREINARAAEVVKQGPKYCQYRTADDILVDVFLATPEELDVFDHLGRRWVPPARREVRV